MKESEESRVAKHDEEGSSEQQIWSWGAGTDGQLGMGRLQDEHLPQLLRLPSLSPAAGSICSLACGGAHVLALTSGLILSFTEYHKTYNFSSFLEKTNICCRWEGAGMGKGHVRSTGSS